MTEQDLTSAIARHLDMVYRIALNYFKNETDAEDAAQETMLRLWRLKPDLPDDEHLKYYLARAAVNVCRGISAKAWRRHDVPLESCLELHFPETTSLLGELMALPAKYRVPLYLHYYEGYSIEETAAIMKLSSGAVRTRLFRAREKMRSQLIEDQEFVL